MTGHLTAKSDVYRFGIPLARRGRLLHPSRTAARHGGTRKPGLHRHPARSHLAVGPSQARIGIGASHPSDWPSPVSLPLPSPVSLWLCKTATASDGARNHRQQGSQRPSAGSSHPAPSLADAALPPTALTVRSLLVITSTVESSTPTSASGIVYLRLGVNKAVDAVISHLKMRAWMISTPEEITQVATISANGDREVGELIAKAMEKVGKDGVITVSDGKTLSNELEVVEGMKLSRGYISPYFVNDQKTQKCELENPLILIHDKKISNMEYMVRILELAVKNSRPLLIVAEDLESDVLAMLILNKLRAGLKVCAVKAPGFGDNRRANLEDLAILTGGELVTEERGLTLEKVRPEMLGTAKKVTISLDDTIILHGGGDKKLIEERCEQLRASFEKSTALFDKEKAQERLSKLSGGVAVIKVGGASEAEVGEKKDRVTDALNAARAAVEEGIVPGGGVALLYATRELEKVQTSNSDQKRGVQIIENALKAPSFAIAANAGADASLVLGKLLEQDDLKLGYDASKGEYVDMVKAGIIDPLKVIRTALLDASSVSLLLTTTEATVVELDTKSNPATSRMPRMDDMDF